MAARTGALKRGSSRLACRALGAASLVAVLPFACHGKNKEEVRVSAVDGESAVLPARGPATIRPMRIEPRTLDVGGARRSWLLVAPTALDTSRRYPLVLVFHGDGGSGSSFHKGFPFERGSGGGAILAYPDGLGATWDLESKKGENKDVRFAKALVDAIAAELPVDKERVFAAGYSSGGFFSNVLACHEPDLLRAISSSAGGAPYNQAEKWPNGYPKCPGQKPVATIALHGERDGTVTLDSGRFSAAYWAYVNGCATSEMETTGHAECRAYRGCLPGKAVAWCVIPPLGHWVWDHAAEASWTFFERIR